MARQVVICDQHLQSRGPCVRNAVDAGNSVIDRNQQIGASQARMGQRHLDDGRRQTVAVLEPIRHQVVDDRTHCAQTENTHRHAGCAIAVVVADDQQATLRADRIGQQFGPGLSALHRCGCQQMGDASLQGCRRINAACGIQAGHQR